MTLSQMGIDIKVSPRLIETTVIKTIMKLVLVMVVQLVLETVKQLVLEVVVQLLVSQGTIYLTQEMIILAKTNIS